MPIFKQTPKSKVVAVIDITSSSVGGALVESNENYPIAISAARDRRSTFFDVNLEASLRCTTDALLRLTAKK